MKNEYPVMTDERIAEFQNFKTKEFSDCPVQTPDQLKEFKPKYPDERLYIPVKRTVQIRLDADVLEWLKQAGPGQTMVRHDLSDEKRSRFSPYRLWMSL
jgi:uncharacterized protein (DUF4415 family)